MKLSKALQVKNKLVNQIRSLERIIRENNSLPKNAVRNYDIVDTHLKLKRKVNDLVQLKLMIEIESGPIRQQILQLGELKSSLNFLNSVSTQHGEVIDRGFRETTTIEYVTTITRQAMDNMIKETEEHIDSLQEQIDHHNHTTEVDIEVDLS